MRPSQIFDVMDLAVRARKNGHIFNPLFVGPPGCHGKGTKILMHDGSIKNVEDIVIGDKLMGPDSQPREVLKLVRGRDEMVKITPLRGAKPFVVNKNHVFHFVRSHTQLYSDVPVHINFNQFETLPPSAQRDLKLTSTGVDFPRTEVPIPPYILGSWLGDGSSAHTAITSMDQEIIDTWTEYAKQLGLDARIYDKENTPAKTVSLCRTNSYSRNKLRNLLGGLDVINNKHIPKEYLCNDRETRLALLAGLIDTDGYRYTHGYEIATVSERLAEDIIYLGRSLGFYVSSRKAVTRCQTKEGCEYFRITINGDLSEVPVKLVRKQQTPKKNSVFRKNILRTGFESQDVGVDEFFGFTVDNDHLYLTADFMIHHNCGKSEIVQAWCKQNNYRFIDIRAALLEAPDVAGFPFVQEREGRQRMIRAIPEFWPDNGKGVIFLDEVNRGPTSVMNTFMQILTDRKVENYNLPEDWVVASGINPEDEHHDVNTMDTAMKDRFEIFPIDYSRQDFLAFMKANNWDPSIIMFVESNAWTYARPEEIAGNEGAKYISPRTFSKLNAALKAGIPETPDDEFERVIYNSILGRLVGTTFYHFRYNEQPVLFKDILDEKTKDSALQKLRVFGDPKNCRSGAIAITIRDIVDNGTITDELLVDVCLSLPADIAPKLISELEFSRKLETSSLRRKLFNDHPKLKKYLKDALLND